MTRSAIVELFQQRQKLWRYADASGLAQAYAEDGVVESPIFGEARGRPEIAASFKELFKIFHAWSFDSDDLVIDGDRVAQIFRLNGMHAQAFFGIPPSWRQFSVQGVMFVEFADERIIHERRIYDFSSMLMQLGLLKRGGPTGAPSLRGE